MRNFQTLLFLSVVAFGTQAANADSSVKLTDITPRGSVLAGDTLVKMTGSGFREDCQVLIGTHACTDFRLIDTKTIACRVSASTLVEQDDVQVQCSEGSSTLSQAFYYFEPLKVEANSTGEVGLPYRLSIEGGVKPYKVESRYGAVTMIDDSHASVGFDRDYTTNNGLDVQVSDALGNALSQSALVYTALAGNYHVQTAIGPGYTIQLPALGGFNPSPLQLVSGDGTLTPGDKGTYVLQAGKSGSLALEAHDQLGGNFQLNINIAQHGYQDSILPFKIGSWGGTNILPNDRLFWITGNKIYVENMFDLPKHYGNVGFVRLNLDGTQDMSWGTGGEAFDLKTSKDSFSVNFAAQQITPDGRMYVAGERTKVHTFSDDSYNLPYLVRYTAAGIVDEKFRPKFKLEKNTALTGLVLRSDGKLWASADHCDPKTSVCEGCVFLIDENGSFEKEMEMPGSHHHLVLTSDAKDGFYLATDSSAYSIEHYYADGSSDSAFRANVQKSLPPIVSKDGVPTTSQLIAQGDVVFASIAIPQKSQGFENDPTTYTYQAFVFHADGTINTGFDHDNVLALLGGVPVTFDAKGNLITASARLLPTGAFDSGFGGNGETIYQLVTDEGYQQNPHMPFIQHSAVAADGGIYLLAQGNYQAQGAIVHIVP
jgi:hypothetical protein